MPKLKQTPRFGYSKGLENLHISWISSLWNILHVPPIASELDLWIYIASSEHCFRILGTYVLFPKATAELTILQTLIKFSAYLFFTGKSQASLPMLSPKLFLLCSVGVLIVL